MKDLSGVKPNRAERRENEAYQRKRAKTYSKITSELTESEKAYEGNVDFSIFNMVMERIPLAGYKDPLDVIRTFYRALYPFMRKLMAENIYLRGVVQEDEVRKFLSDYGHIEEEDFDTIMKSSADPFEECKKILNKVRDEAIKQGKKNSKIIKPKGPTIITR